MADQSVKGVHVILPNIIRVLQAKFETLCEVKVSQAKHSFQKPLFCRYGETKNSEIVPKKYLVCAVS